MILQETIADLEKRLLDAMLHSDVATLNELLAEDLVFTDHTGRLVSKQQDLELHRSGALKINTLQAGGQIIRIYGPTALVSVLLDIQGLYQGQAFAGRNRYTRLWVQENGSWKVAAGHSSTLTTD